ncbi:MAG TPA: hypothetical protein VGE66_10970 [Chitinophagaceae bacterium]
MQSNFTNDDFEQFLRQNADSCRLRPSEDLWKGVSRKLNKQKRRVRLATGVFLMAASFLGFFLVDSSQSMNRTLATATAEVNGTDSRENDGLAATQTAPAVKSTAPQKQKPAAVRDIHTAPGFFRPQASASTADATTAKEIFSTPSPASDIAGRPPVTELAPVIPMFRSEDLSSALASKTAEALPDKFSDQIASAPVAEATNTEKEKKDRDLLSVESVASVFRALRPKSKFTFQVFFTPTVSYRKLSENKAYLQSAPPNPTATTNIASFYSVNNAVTHKPDIGIELGIAAKYPVTKNIKVKGGLQFNMNRYDIKAFSYAPEVATIALNTGNNQADYFGSVTRYRNFGGNTTNWLQNFYFQVSAPVGVELTLGSKKETRFGIASSLQPTYLVRDRAYLISSDYKNYTEVPWLTRKWNVNTSVETFVSYSTGRMRWQVGPQVRYQLLSSFITEYPVKENLFDFGLKVGVSLNNANDK